MSTKGTALAQPIKIGPRTAKNRFVIQPMECGDAINGGHLSPRAIERYEKLMEGDAGVIDFESITMQYDSRARTNQIALYPNDPEDIKEWILRNSKGVVQRKAPQTEAEIPAEDGGDSETPSE